MAKLNFSIALGLAANNFKQGLNGVQNQLKGFASSVKSVFGMVAGAFAAGQIKAFSQECMNAYSAQLQAEQKLSVIMKQRMGVTDAEVKSVLKLASAQQELGVIGDEVQLAGAQQVATFLNEKKSLDTLVPAMNNLLAQQKGLNATQGDAVNIGNLMGKVMQGQTSALKRVGISFTEAEEKVLKFGKEEQKAAMLAQVIKNNVGEMNAALAQTDAGKMQQLANTLGDLKEKIGAALMPIMGQLAPMISNFATNGANAIVGFINTVQQNIKALVGFIVAQFAGIMLLPYIMKWVADFKNASLNIATTVSHTNDQRVALERKAHLEINKIRKLETAAEAASGQEKVRIEQKLLIERAKLRDILKQRNAAAIAETVALESAAALQIASVWGKAMLMAKMSFIGFMTTVKTLFRSFAPLLIFEILFTVGMKVYDMLSKNSKGFMALAKVVGGAVMTAISNLASMLAAIFDYVADLFGLVDKKGKKYRSKKTGKVYNSMEELNAAEGKGSKAKPTPGSGGGTGGTTTPKTKQESDYQQWLKNYTNDIAKADASLKLNNITLEEYNNKRLDQIKSAQEDLALMKAANPAEAKLIEAKKKSLAAEREYYTILTTETVVTGSSAQGALRKAGKKAAESRDTTFDYKLSDKDKVIADLEFSKQSIQEQLAILKNDAIEKTDEVLNEIAKLETDDIGLDKALKLEKVKQDVESLKKQMTSMTLEAIQQGWQAVESTVNNIASLAETLNDPDVSGWEKFCAVMNTLMSLMQTITGVMQTVNTLMEISTALKEANAAASQQEAISAGSAAMGHAADTTAKAASSGASLPFPANIAAIAAGVAAGLSVVATIASIIGSFSKGGIIPRFAAGGIFGGASPVGDFGLARVNSGEMIINKTGQSRLLRLANGAGTANQGPINLRMKVRGRDLITCEDNEARISAISGRKVNH